MSATGSSRGLSGQVVWPILLTVTVLAAGLRLFNLDSNLWYDEIRTLIDSVRRPLGEIVTHFPGTNDHLLYSVLGHASVATFGERSWSLRLPAALFGIATIPMLYVFGTKVTSRLEALAAAVLLAVSYHHVWFSQNARGYTALLFFTLLATYLLLIALEKDSRSAYLGYAAATALGAYTHLTMVFVGASHALIVAWRLLRARHFRLVPRDWVGPALGFGLAGLLTVLLYAPILLAVQAFFEQAPQQVNVAPASWAILETLRGLRIGFATAGGAVLALFLLMLGCWSYLRQSPSILALFLLPGPITLAVAVILQRPTFPRFFFFLAGFALLIAVRGVVIVSDLLSRRLPSAAFGGRLGELLPVALLAGVMGVSAIALPHGYRYPKQDFEQALRFVEASVGADDLIAVVGGGAAFPYQHYYQRPWQRLTSAAELAAARGRHESVWLLYTLARYIEALEPDLMNEIRTTCSPDKTFPGTVAGGNIVVTRCPAN